jgi:hypothetical protein
MLHDDEGYSRVVSASSSFFLLILSFSVSASRRACWMRACIASGDTSFGRPASISSGESEMRWGIGEDGKVVEEPDEVDRGKLTLDCREDWVCVDNKKVDRLSSGAGVVEECKLQGVAARTSKTASQDPMLLNEMTVQQGVERRAGLITT